MPRVLNNNLFRYPVDSPTRTQPFPNTSGKIDQGYFVKPPYPDKSMYHNGKLSFTTHFNKQTKIPNKTYEIDLFIYDIQLGMSLSGETAQSQKIRQFYAYNIELPEMTVICQARSSFEQSYIAEYIRFTQVAMVGSNISSSAASNDNLVRFTLDKHTQLRPNHKGRGSRAVTYVPPAGSSQKDIQRRASNGDTMGSRMGFDIYCYITDVTRAVQVGENAYQFAFTVAIVDKNKGLPFSSNNSATDSVEGVQWTWEMVDNAKANGISYVNDPGITVVETKPHQSSKKKGVSGSTSKPQVPPQVAEHGHNPGVTTPVVSPTDPFGSGSIF